MRKKNKTATSTQEEERFPRRLRLPGFIQDEEIGLGDLLKQVTSSAGIKPCVGCLQRAIALNRWLVISGRQSKTK